MRLLKKLSALMIVLALLSATVYAEPGDILATPVDATIPEADAGLDPAGTVPDEPMPELESGDDALPGEAVGMTLPEPEDDEANAPVVLSVSKSCAKSVYVGTVYQIKVPGKQIKSCKSSAKKIAAVSKSGRVTPKKAGKATITITLKNKKTIILKLNVKKQPAAKKVTIKAAGSLTLSVGDTLKLSATVSPARASQSVTWKSGNKSVATVSAKGLVTAKKAGKATITAKAKNGKKASVTVVVEKQPELSDLKADPEYIDAGRANTVTFTVRRSGASAQSDVLLRDGNGTLLGAMRDDGMEGDAKAGDGVYTLVVGDIAPQTPSVFTYRAETDLEASNTLTLMAFLVACPENGPIAQAQIDTTSDQIMAAEQPYADAEGYVSSKDVPAILSALEARLSQLQAEGSVLTYSVGKDSAYIKLPSGIGIVYEPPVKGMLAGDKNIPLAITSVQTSPAEFATIPNAATEKALIDILKPFLERYGLYQGFENPGMTSITRETIKNLGSNRIISWYGHGTIVKTKVHGAWMSCLMTSEKLSIDEWKDESNGYSDLFNRDLLVIDRFDFDSVKNLYSICVTPYYFEEYCSPLTDDIIFLTACHSGQDNILMLELAKDKKAAGVVGYTDSVECRYGFEILANTLAYMTLIDPSTHDYYTLEDALAKAKQISGSSYYAWAKKRGVTLDPGDPNASPVSLYGKNRPARLVHVANQQFTVTDKNGVFIPGAEVILKGKNKQFKTQMEVSRISALPKCRVWNVKAEMPEEVVIDDKGDLILKENTNNIPIPAEDFGNYEFTVSAKNFIPVKQSYDVKKGRAFEFELALDGSCKVSATDKATGKKLSRVKVECVFKKTGEKQTVHTDANGAHTIPLDTPGVYTLTFSKAGYRDRVETVTVSQNYPKVALPVQLEPECLEVSGLYGMNIRSAATWIGGKLDYRYDSLEQPYEIYYNKDIEFSGWAGGNTTYVDSILIHHSDRYSLFGVKYGMTKQQAMEKMKKYRAGSSDDFPTGGGALYYVIRSSGGYPAVYVRIGLKNGKVNSVIYEGYGN